MRFPVLKDRDLLREYPECPADIAWEIVAPYERQAQRNHSQTLKRLAERGGLAPSEIYCLVRGERLRWIPNKESVQFLQGLIHANNHDPASWGGTDGSGIRPNPDAGAD